MTPSVLSSWLVRLLLAVTLLFGSEILLWPNPPARAAVDWLPLLIGSVILAALILDLTVHYRVNNRFGALVLAGIFSLLAAVLVNPQFAFADMPRTFITRVMGAQALVSALMFGLFVLLTGSGQQRGWLLVGGLVVGLWWGVWMRWWPPDEGYSQVSLEMMVIYGVVGLAVIGALLALVPPRAARFSLDDLRLSRVGWGLVMLLALALFVLRLAQGVIDLTGLGFSAVIAVLCWAILWFRHSPKGATLLDHRLPINRPRWLTLLIAVILFLAAAVYGYTLPELRLGPANQLTLIGLAFTAYGLVWLPTVALVLGAQGYVRQTRRRLL